MGGVAVGEHLAPQHGPQQLEVLLALVGVRNLALPEDAALEVAVLPDQVITAARALAQALGVLRRRPRGHRGAGGEVGVEQEAGDGITSLAGTSSAHDHLQEKTAPS